MRRLLRRSAVSIEAIVIMMVLVGCTASERFDYTEIIMGVDARIVLYAKNEGAARPAARAAFDRLRDLDRTLSDYLENSELNRLSASAGQGPQPVGRDLLDVLDHAERAAAASDGAFDVTVGPIVALWRAARREGRLPEVDALASARTRVGHELVRVDRDAGTVTLFREGMRLDLGGIGKGYGVDAVFDTLRGRGCDRVLVDVGGDLRVGKAPPGRRGWRVSIDDTQHTLTHAAVAASGDTEQFLQVDGVRYSHIIDPRTGRAIVNGPRVTVIADDATTADALASAISVLGPRDGVALAKRFGVGVRIDTPASDGQVTRTETRDFSRR